MNKWICLCEHYYNYMKKNESSFVCVCGMNDW